MNSLNIHSKFRVVFLQFCITQIINETVAKSINVGLLKKLNVSTIQKNWLA